MKTEFKQVIDSISIGLLNKEDEELFCIQYDENNITLTGL